MLRPRIVFVVAACTAFLLSGCLEITQHVTQVRGRTVSVFVKVGIARALLEMAEGFVGGAATAESACEEVFLAEDDLFEDARVVRLERIYTETECGALYAFEYDVRKQNATDIEDIPFFVSVAPDFVEILLPGLGDRGAMDEMALAFLASSKYRLTISKTVMKTISSASVSYTYDADETIEGHDSVDALEYELDVIDMADQHLIEMSLAMLFLGDETITLTLTLLR